MIRFQRMEQTVLQVIQVVVAIRQIKMDLRAIAHRQIRREDCKAIMYRTRVTGGIVILMT